MSSTTSEASGVGWEVYSANIWREDLHAVGVNRRATAVACFSVLTHAGSSMRTLIVPQMPRPRFTAVPMIVRTK